MKKDLMPLFIVLAFVAVGAFCSSMAIALIIKLVEVFA